MKRLEALPQYHIDRDTMVKLVDNIIGIDRLEDLFCYGDLLTLPSFSAFRYEDEYYIIHRDSGMMINWYKHIGRTNTCSQSYRGIEDYIEFFMLLNEEMKEGNL